MPPLPHVADQSVAQASANLAVTFCAAFPLSVCHSLQLSMRPEDEQQPSAPSWPWRAASSFTMGAVGVLCRGFLLGLSKTEVHGLDGFLDLLDEREHVEGRTRGLITGSLHPIMK